MIWNSIFELAASDDVKIYITINSFSDIIYFVSKHYEADETRTQMNGLPDIVTIIEAGHRDALKSLKTVDFNGIEDALQAQCAMKEGLDFIITRDANGFKSLPIKALSPEEYLERTK